MTMKKTFLTGLLVLTAGVSHAYWIGNQGLSIQEKGGALEIIYDTGERDIVPENGGPSVDLESHRLYAQWRYGASKSVQLVGRVLPGTGRLDLDNSNFNPNVWGLGGGIQFSPREKLGAVRVGASAAYDINFGESGDDEIRWTEFTAATGVSYDPAETVRVYGGLSIIKDTYDFEFNPGNVQVDYKNDDSWGLFAGVNFLPADPWVISFEAHFLNEAVFGFNLRYRF
jgi:hypothetical protein